MSVVMRLADMARQHLAARTAVPVRQGVAGATVFQAVAGFGAHSVVHTSHILRLSQDLPIVIEVVDTQEHVERLLPILDEMVAEGLVTLEKARVVKYAAGRKPEGR